MVSTKRRRDDDDTDEGTPRKLRARITEEPPDEYEPFEAQTPSRKGRAQQLAENGTPRSILKKTGLANGIHINGTPKSARKLVFETPTKPTKDETPDGTPTIVRNADRSARRKSNRRILERALNGAESEDEALEEGDILAEQILAEEEEEEEDEVVEQAQQAAAQEPIPVPETPTKRGRGRPKGSGKVKKPRSPTPPTELPPHEEYFWQNRPGGTKTSNNTLSAQSLLNHDEYFQAMQSYRDRHEPEMQFLLELHSRAYDQWIFELDEGFNICLYGYGSKRTITEDLTARLYHHLLEQVPYTATKKTPRIVVINGYSAGTTIKDILTTIASAAVPTNVKMPNQPTALLDFLLEYLSNNPSSHPVPVVINSIDSPYLRKSPNPTMLARLASHPCINLICTADTPNFPLLWDVGLKTQYKFLFHDTTTFAPYDAEIDAVETVNDLLGRSGRRMGGRDGVGFVLRSLPENARELFRILVMEQLTLSFVDGGGLGEDEDIPATPRSKKVPQTKHVVSESSQGVEYRVLYHKAVEAFVCSSEVGFRTLLKEFHDHQMIESRKDAMGTERLWVPFRQEELEGLAEDLAGDAF
ncbi:ORC2-domain-containing protein [Cucurbitaria berberidis CBS 394.84]|uniref:Origin recognition complex subunit 2 n=1 Tax=Cucurbitaria berberidis CBS 394.84 TaxID=1168544 RepID=A0A9P4LDP3_9PLEO|nr:ORC2-domain-containing protein [Cucurbitaria berberidis CBS 394.84]KAF1851225.1 ORC2-domain-containing protein [Cucurbitaria berberidis CBS 394.84]